MSVIDYCKINLIRKLIYAAIRKLLHYISVYIYLPKHSVDELFCLYKRVIRIL